jgi:YD repeat-containing protein
VQEWNAQGRLRTSATDPLGRTSRYAYDADDNLTAVTYPDGTSSVFTYDRLGRPAEMTDTAGRTWRAEYDESGNVVASTDPMGARTAYTYDDRGDLVVVTDPLGAQTYVANPFAWIDPLGLDSKYEELPGWKDGEPIDTTWNGRVTYRPLDGRNRPGPVTAEIHKDMLG